LVCLALLVNPVPPANLAQSVSLVHMVNPVSQVFLVQWDQLESEADLVKMVSEVHQDILG
jgi:hypothetical protein